MDVSSSKPFYPVYQSSVTTKLSSHQSTSSEWYINSPSLFSEKLEADVKEIKLRTYVTVLKECHDKLQILGMIGNMPTVKASMKFGDVSQYKIGKQHSFVFDPTTLETFVGYSDKQAFLKYQRDRSFVEQMVYAAMESYADGRYGHHFGLLLRRYQKSEKEKVDLKRNTTENIAMIKFLSVQVDKEKVRLLLELQKKSDKLGKLKDEYEDTFYENSKKSKYVNTWEDSRCYQNQVDHSRKEKNLVKTVEDAYSNYDKELKIHVYMEEFLEIVQQEHLKGVEKWMVKYEDDLVHMNFKISKQRGNLERLQERFIKLADTYENHKAEIEEYLILREKRRELERIVQVQIDAATTIQAWWRGMMCRHCLGPYRRRKAKKSKGKADKDPRKKQK